MVKVEILSFNFDALAPRTVGAVRVLMRSREGAARWRGLQSRRRLAPPPLMDISSFRGPGCWSLG